jgi:hypothetical protein
MDDDSKGSESTGSTGGVDMGPDEEPINLPRWPFAEVGDVTSNEPGSGARFNSGKPDYSLIPLCTLEDEARVWMHGKAKYAAWNWAKGMAWSVPFGCAMRHLAAWQKGEEIDPESGLPHLAHAMCNLRMLTLYSKTFRVGDDRPAEWMP